MAFISLLLRSTAVRTSNLTFCWRIVILLDGIPTHTHTHTQGCNLI